jgi:hypothetical protein
MRTGMWGISTLETGHPAMNDRAMMVNLFQTGFFVIMILLANSHPRLKPGADMQKPAEASWVYQAVDETTTEFASSIDYG